MVLNKGVKIAAVFIIPVMLFLIFMYLAPGFGFHSLEVILSQSVIPILMGYGMAFGMAAGIFDLSTGSRVLVAATFGGVLSYRFGIPGMVVGSIVSGVVIGMIMGVCHNLFRIPSLVLSLGFVMLLEVVTHVVMGASSFLQISAKTAAMGKPPYNFIVGILLSVVFYVLYYRTKFSYHVRVIGNHELLAKNMGINPRQINFLCFAVGGAFLGVVGILQLCYSNSVSGALNMSSLSMVFQPMMGVMIGMELLAVIDNLALNIIIGELCISMIFTGLIAMGLPSTMQDVVLGIFMIIIMAVSANKEVIRAFRKRMAAVNL
ncbi:MAG: ABC transporter permease [Lachnospiraceae bacterium]